MFPRHMWQTLCVCGWLLLTYMWGNETSSCFLQRWFCPGALLADDLRRFSLWRRQLHVYCCNWEAESPSNPSKGTSSGCFYTTMSLMFVATKVSSKVTKTGGNKTCKLWALLYNSHNILEDVSYWDYRDLSGTWTYHGWVLPSGHGGFYTTFPPSICRRKQNKSLTQHHTLACSPYSRTCSAWWELSAGGTRLFWPLFTCSGCFSGPDIFSE